MRKTILSIIIFCFSFTGICQDFIHDTISVYSDEITYSYLFGYSTSEDLSTDFEECKLKGKLKKTGKGENRSYEYFVNVILPGGTFFTTSSSANDRENLSYEGKLTSVTFTPSSVYLPLHPEFLQLDRSALEAKLGEGEKLSKKETYYADHAMQVRFCGRKAKAKVKSITYYESQEVSDKNFEIYLKWKSQQEQ